MSALEQLRLTCIAHETLTSEVIFSINARPVDTGIWGTVVYILLTELPRVASITGAGVVSQERHTGAMGTGVGETVVNFRLTTIQTEIQ